MKRTLSSVLSLLLAAASASAQVPASGLTKIGTAAAVRGAVNAVSAGAPVGRVISSGKPLFLNDHVTTDAAGRLQVLLVDETIFTLGPNSDMVLDDFVYDPKTSAGKITASIAKGTFRFVTGKIAQHDPEKLKIKVAIGTIGVRGSIGVGETGPGGTTIINGGARNADNHDDAAGIYAQNGGKTVNLPQPGVGTRIGTDGRVEDAHFMAGELNRIMGTLQAEVGKSSGKGGSGGSVGSRRSATDASGRSTSVGGLLASDSQDSAEITSTLDSTLVNTLQSINGGRVSTWDEIRSIPSGTGSYAGNGTYLCTGGSCGAGTTGTWDFIATVNFGAQTVNGNIQLNGAISDNGTLSPALNYSSLSGDAKSSLTYSAVGNFAGTTGTFSDRGGTIAKDLTVNMTYADTLSHHASGTATGSR